MEERPIVTSAVYLVRQESPKPVSQPPTPVSPSLPTPMPPLPERILELPNLSNGAVSNSCITPPVGAGEPSWQTQSVLVTAIHVLTTEASALSHLAHLYKTDPVAQSGFTQAVDAIAGPLQHG